MTLPISSVSSALGVLVRPGDDVLQVGDPHHVVGVLADHRDAGEAAAQRQHQCLAEGLVPLDEHHVRARHHDLADDGVAKFEDRADHLPLPRLDLGPPLDVVDEALHFRPPAQLVVDAVTAQRQRAGHRVKQPRQRAEQPVQRAQQRRRGARDPLGALPAHGTRPHPDQHVPRDEQGAGRGQEHLPAAVQPVRVGQRHQNGRRHLGAHPYQGQQAAVPREPVRVGPGHGGLRARAPARGEYQHDRGYQQPPCG